MAAVRALLGGLQVTSCFQPEYDQTPPGAQAEIILHTEDGAAAHPSPRNAQHATIGCILQRGGLLWAERLRATFQTSEA